MSTKVTKTLLANLAIVWVTGCHSIAPAQPKMNATTASTETVQLQQPLLTFEVIPIPGPGVAEEVVGDIKVLVRDEEWVSLIQGSRVDDGSKVQLGAGSRMRLRFASNESAELKSPGRESWLVFELVRGR